MSGWKAVAAAALVGLTLLLAACLTPTPPTGQASIAAPEPVTRPMAGPVTVTEPPTAPPSRAYVPYIVRAFSHPTPTSTPAPVSDLSLTRGPLLQRVTTDTVVVVWETERAAPGEVVYGETADYGSIAADTAIAARHVVTLTDLSPYTRYRYRVTTGGSLLLGGPHDATFRTAAPPGADFTFIAFGDTRTQQDVHRAVVGRIAAEEPDFLLHTGDLVEDGSQDDLWDTFFEIEQPLLANTPFFPVMGNHEGGSSRYLGYFHLPGNERWYTFDYGAVRFVALEIDTVADYGPGSEQYAWLESTLAANERPWLFLFFHVAPFTSVEDLYELDVRAALQPLIERYGVDLVINGHKHSYERNMVNGIPYIVTAGGGAPLYYMAEREPTQVVFVRAHHFVRVAVSENQVTVTAVAVDGEVLDQFTLTK